MICRIGLSVLMVAAVGGAQETWRWGVDGNDWKYAKGSVVRELRTPDGLRVSMGESFEHRGHVIIPVMFSNATGGRVDVVPEKFELIGQGKDGREVRLAYRNPEGLAKRIKGGARRRAGIGAALAGAAAGLSASSRTTGTATDGRGGTVTYSEQTYDHERSRRAGDRARESARGEELFAAGLEELGLKAETLTNGEAISGQIAFKREKGVSQAVLEMPVGARRVSFPVDLK